MTSTDNHDMVGDNGTGSPHHAQVDPVARLLAIIHLKRFVSRHAVVSTGLVRGNILRRG